MNKEPQLAKKEGTDSSEGDIGTLLNFLKPHRRQLGISKYDELTLEGDVILCMHSSGQRREIYINEGVLVELRDTDGGRVVNSYCAGSNGNLKHLYKTNFEENNPCVNAYSRSNKMFRQLKSFIEGGYKCFEEGIEQDNGGFKVRIGDRTIYFHNNYMGVTEDDLLRFVPPQPFYEKERSLFAEALGGVMTNGYSELTKHKIFIVMAKNRISFERMYHNRLWSV